MSKVLIVAMTALALAACSNQHSRRGEAFDRAGQEVDAAANSKATRSKGDVLGQAGRFLKLLLQPLSTFVQRRFRDNRLRQVLGYPAVFLGSSPYLTPSMYHLMSHLDLADGVLYPIGGFTRVIESIADLARAEGATIITRAEVTRIVVENGKATGVEYLDGNRDIQFVDADIVVSAADLHHSETELLKPEEQTYPQEYWDTKTPGPSALLLYLGGLALALIILLLS